MWVVVLFVILLILLLILFLISGIKLIFPIVLASIPAWGAGLIVAALTLSAIRKRTINSVRSSHKLTDLVNLRLDRDKITCTINDAEIQKYVASNGATSPALLYCLATTFGILVFYLVGTNIFQGHRLSMINILGDEMAGVNIPEIVVFALAGAISIIPISFIFKTLKSQQSLNQSIKVEVDRLVASANLSLAATDRLYNIINRISSLSASLEINFPDEYTESIRQYIELHKPELLISTKGLDRVIEEQTSKANDDCSHLEKANSLHEAAMRFYTETSRHVNSTGSMPLIKELEYHYAGLTFPDLRSLLPLKRWSEYYDIVNSILEDLQMVKDLASRYEKNPDIDEEPEIGPEEDSRAKVERGKIETAYTTLGVSPTATDEEIKKAVGVLRRAFHPDRAMTGDKEIFEKKLQYINEAYNTIKVARNKRGR